MASQATKAEVRHELAEELAEEKGISCDMCQGHAKPTGKLGVRVYYRCTACGMDMSRVPGTEVRVAALAIVPKKKVRAKTRVAVRAHFDRAGGCVDGEMVIDKETGIVTVREKRSRKTYSMTLTELVDHICRTNLNLGRKA